MSAKSAKKTVVKAKKTASKKTASKKKLTTKKTGAVSAKKSTPRKKKPVISEPEISTPIIYRPVEEEAPPSQDFVDIGRFESEIYEPDPEIKEAFAEAAVLGDPSRKFLLDDLRENSPAESPILSGGDLDAAWDQADASGEETVGGSNPTPDQDVVDQLGEAVGLTYQNNEPLNSEEKLEERDTHRWELEPASAEDFEERTEK
ncbi:MAG: DUF6335 family protein [Acidobacteria bacterium]|nr:DUF6335 family protein [Acidobacteriota bacterium]